MKSKTQTNQKGITPVIAVTLLILVTVAAAGTLYATIEETQEEVEENAPEIDFHPETLEKESCWVEEGGDENISISLRNDSPNSIDITNLDVIVDGQELDYELEPEGNIRPRGSFYITFTDAEEDEVIGGSEIMTFNGENSQSFYCWG